VIKRRAAAAARLGRKPWPLAAAVTTHYVDGPRSLHPSPSPSLLSLSLSHPLTQAGDRVPRRVLFIGGFGDQSMLTFTFAALYARTHYAAGASAAVYVSACVVRSSGILLV